MRRVITKLTLSRAAVGDSKLTMAVTHIHTMITVFSADALLSQHQMIARPGTNLECCEWSHRTHRQGEFDHWVFGLTVEALALASSPANARTRAVWLLSLLASITGGIPCMHAHIFRSSDRETSCSVEAAARKHKHIASQSSSRRCLQHRKFTSDCAVSLHLSVRQRDCSCLFLTYSSAKSLKKR